MARHETRAHQRLRNLRDMIVGQALLRRELGQRHGFAATPRQHDQSRRPKSVCRVSCTKWQTRIRLPESSSINTVIEIPFHESKMRTASPPLRRSSRPPPPSSRRAGWRSRRRCTPACSKIRRSRRCSIAPRSRAAPSRKLLAGAILAYARNIDKLENLTTAVNRMVERHVQTGVKAEHNPHVAAALLPAIRDVLGGRRDRRGARRLGRGLLDAGRHPDRGRREKPIRRAPPEGFDSGGLRDTDETHVPVRGARPCRSTQSLPMTTPTSSPASCAARSRPAGLRGRFRPRLSRHQPASARSPAGDSKGALRLVGRFLRHRVRCRDRRLRPGGRPCRARGRCRGNRLPSAGHMGQHGHQEVPHLHVHIFGGRQFYEMVSPAR